MKVLYRNISIIFIFCFTFSCTQNPALVENRSTYTKNVKSFSSLNNPFKITVKSGDNLYKISKQYGVGIRELIELNNLRPPYLLNPSQVLKLPKAKFHVVGEGDTLYAVSRSYGVDLSRLIHVNDLQEPYIIKVGAKLRIPSSTESYQYLAQKTEDSSNKQKTGVIASVVEKDLNKLKEKKATPQYILPNEVKPERINGGTELSSKSEAIIPRLRPNDNPRPNLKPGTVLASSPKVKYQKASYKSSFSRTPTPSSGFSWPARGTIISRFGPKKGGLYNDGINIRASEGSSIFASDNGEVVYAGNELRGYGNLVLLKHSNGYVTAYAHARDILVRKGDVVKKGEKIASVGNTGHVSVPQLHFSIRKGRKAINPQSYLPRS